MGASRRRFITTAVAGLAAGAGAWALAQPAPRVIAVSARRFTFRPDRIALRRGEPVVFELTSEDVVMGFNIPDLHVRTDIVPGRTMRLAVTPERVGTFPFLCDVFCGEGHESMSGEIVVT